MSTFKEVATVSVNQSIKENDQELKVLNEILKPSEKSLIELKEELISLMCNQEIISVDKIFLEDSGEDWISSCYNDFGISTSKGREVFEKDKALASFIHVLKGNPCEVKELEDFSFDLGWV